MNEEAFVHSSFNRFSLDEGDDIARKIPLANLDADTVALSEERRHTVTLNDEVCAGRGLASQLDDRQPSLPRGIN